MTTTTVFVNDVGTIIRLDTGVDISNATETVIVMRKPDKTTVELSASIYDTTTLQYITVDGDINAAGTYKVQAKVVTPDWSGRGSIATFNVLSGLSD